MSSPSKFDDSTLFDSLQEHVKEEVGTEVLGGGSVPVPTTATETKRLVLLMGPQGLHHWDDLVTFFLHHMSEYRPQQHLEALHGWMWPAIHLPSDETPSDASASISNTRILDLLSNENDENITTAMMQQLNVTWQQSTHGILMGAPTWDQNASRIVEQLRDNFGISNEQIQLVWMIPPSYFPQWYSFYAQEDDDDDNSYQEWICNPSQSQSHVQRLETSLNTVHLATQFLVQPTDFPGISVTLLDQRGVMQAQQSLPHVIACRILNVPSCQDGWIPGLDREVSVVDIPSTNMDSPISLDDQLEFEALLQDRDCAYQNELENHPHFRHLFPAALWEGCPDDEDDLMNMEDHDSLYQRLQNATLILEQIQIESNCHIILGDAGTTSTTFAGMTTDAPIASPLPTMTPQMLSDLEEVESSLESSTRWGIAVLTVFLVLMTVWIGLIRRRRRAASRKKEQQVLRSWEHDENMDIHRFDMSTIKNCHVSGRYDEEEDGTTTAHNNKDRNLHYYQDYDDDEDDQVHSTNTQAVPSSSLYYINNNKHANDFEEIDLQWTAATESAELERIQREGIMS